MEISVTTGDFKRRFEPVTVQSLENPFLSDNWTKPHRFIEDAVRWSKVTRNENLTSLEKARLLSDLSLRLPGGGRPTKEESGRRREERIKTLKCSGKTEREIAKELKISKSTVHDVLSRAGQEG